MNKKELTKNWLGDCLPTIFALLMSGLYSVMDGLFIGRAVGDAGLAAVNLAWPIPAVITALGIAIGIGGSILYSTARGKGEYIRGERWYRLSVGSLVATGCLLTVLLYLGYPWILQILGAKGEVYEQAARYSQIITGGCLFQILGGGMIPILRNRGMALGAMISMTTGMLSNLGLNYILIFGFGLGIRGAAIGTVTAQGSVIIIGSILILRQGRRKAAAIRAMADGDSIESKENKDNKESKELGLAEAIFQIFKTGISAFGLSLAPTVVLIFTNYRCLRYGGDTAVACYAVISYITFPVQSILTGIGDGSQPLMSYFNGCKRREEVEFIKRSAKRLATVSGFVLMTGVWIAAPILPKFFGLSDVAEQYFVQGMRISSAAFLFMGAARFHIAYMGAILRTKEASLLIYGETMAISPFLLLVLPEQFGMTGIWCVLPASQVIMLLLYKIRYGRSEKETVEN